MQTVNVDIFKNSVAFTATFSRWGNVRRIRKNGDNETPTDGAPADRIRKSKVLLIAKEYDAIVSHQNETRARIDAMSVPSFFKRGFSLIATSGIEKMERYLKSRIEEQEELVKALVQVYPDKLRDSEKALGQYWDARDYPNIPKLMSSFSIRWNWIAFGIPESLPKEIFEAEKAKAEQVWAEASDQITMALRGGFKELLDNAIERLTVEPGEKPKTFRDTLVGNIVEFIDLFKDRNITNDAELEQLVCKAKEVVTGLKPDDLRKDEDLRGGVLSKFSELAQNLDTMIEQMPVRQFNFDDTEGA